MIKQCVTRNGLAAGADAFARGDFLGALKKLIPLARKGDVAARCLLGHLYDNGKGVKRDPKEAFYWYRLAARWPIGFTGRQERAMKRPPGTSNFARIGTLRA